MTPSKPPVTGLPSASVGPWPSGRKTGNAYALSFVRISFNAFSKFAPVRSILLTNAMRGTLYLVACRQTVSDCGCTPATPQNTATAPSSTRMERSTSAVKSTWPGVSMMLMRCGTLLNALKILSSPGLAVFCVQKQVTAADVIVMPRSFSCSIQSVTVLPSSTSPILWMRPV